MNQTTLPTTWDLTPLFESDTDPAIQSEQQRLTQQIQAFAAKWKSRTDYLEQAEVLRQALDEYEQLHHTSGISGKQYYYFWLRSEQNQNDPAIKAALNKAEEFANHQETALQFFTIRLARVSPILQNYFLHSPLLIRYQHFLENLYEVAAYILSEPEEQIMTMKSAPAHDNWIKMTASLLTKQERTGLLEDGTQGKLSLEQILSLLSSKQKPVRDQAAENLNSVLFQFRDLAEHELNAILGNKKIDDQIRKVARPDLTKHLHDDIESEVVDSLLDAVSDRFDISQRYYQLKANLLGLDQLEYHERNVPYGSLDKTYSYEEAVDLAQTTFTRLDSQFAQIFTQFVQNGHIDALPRTNKRGGAFCTHHSLADPVYILLNHTGVLQDVLTLAHEAGHGINNELIRARQHALYFGTSTATAEVASTFMEDFVLEEIMRNASPEERLAIQMMKLNDDISTIFRQTAAYRFEQSLHSEFRKTGYLSADQIGQLFQKEMFSYMGKVVKQSPGSENWWIYWSHIRNFFYVYSYASGLLISKSLQNSVKANHADIGKVKEFLSAGRSQSTKAIFEKVGITISNPQFWQHGLNEVDALLADTEKLARELGKI